MLGERLLNVKTDLEPILQYGAIVQNCDTEENKLSCLNGVFKFRLIIKARPLVMC